MLDAKNNTDRFFQTLLLFAFVTIAGGFYMLNGLGRHFGLAKDESRGTVDRKAAVAVTVMLVLLICVELAL